MPAWSDFSTPQDHGSYPGCPDDLPFFNAALAAGNLYIPNRPGGYNLSYTCVVPGGRAVIGSDAKPQIMTPINNADLFDIAGSDITIRNIRANFLNLANGGGLFRLRNDLGSMERIDLSNCLTFGANYLVRDFVAGSTMVTIDCANIRGRLHRGIGFDFNKAYAYLRMTDNLVDYVGGGAQYQIAYACKNNQGAWWTRCDCTGGIVDQTNTGNHGFYFQNSVANWLTDCMSDTMGGGGLFLNGGNSHFYIHKFISSLCGTHQFSIVGNDKITLSASEAGGRAGLPYAPNYPGFVGINTTGLIWDDACRGYNNVGGSTSVTNCPGIRNNVY